MILKKEDYDRIPNSPGDEEMDMLDLAYELSDTWVNTDVFVDIFTFVIICGYRKILSHSLQIITKIILSRTWILIFH